MMPTAWLIFHHRVCDAAFQPHDAIPALIWLVVLDGIDRVGKECSVAAFVFPTVVIVYPVPE